jgi:hypothetical protein
MAGARLTRRPARRYTRPPRRAPTAVARGAALPALERDYLEIDRVLRAMVDEVQDRLAAISPWMALLDRVGDRTDEALCGFCPRVIDLLEGRRA